MRRARALARDPETPVIALATAHPAKFPDAVERAIGVRPPLPPHLADLETRPERFAVLPNDPAAVARFVRDAGEGRGLSVDSRPCLRACGSSPTRTPHLRTASLGVFVGAGSRHERDERARPVASARAHGVQGHAPAQRARDRRGDRERRRRPQRRDRRRADRLFRAGARRRRRPGARRSRRHPDRQPVRRRRARPREERHRAGDRRSRGHARRSRFRPFHRRRLAGAADRPTDPWYARKRGRFRSRRRSTPI